MAQQIARAEPQPAPIDERVARVGLLSHVFRRPEIGSLVGVVAVFALFTITAHGFAGLDGLARWSDEASNIGIMAVPVALLLSGRLDLRDQRVGVILSGGNADPGLLAEVVAP